MKNIHSFETKQESLAMLKVLAQSANSLKQGKSKPAKRAFTDLRKKIARKHK